MMYLSAAGSSPRDTRYPTIPSLTSVPITCPAAHSSAVRQLPSTRLAPNMASAIRAGQAVANVWVTNAEATRQPTGSWRRLCTLVLAHPRTAAWSCADSAA